MANKVTLDDWNKYTGHFWCRTGETCLDDEGISEVALKRVGDWKSVTVDMQYINAIRVAQEKHLAMLIFPTGLLA